MTSVKRQDWIPDQNLAVSALAWQAARPELARRAWSWWSVPLRILGGAGGRRLPGTGSAATPPTAGSYTRELSNDRLADYAVAVDEVSERLTRPETDWLRSTGELPDWFIDEVETSYRAWRRAKKRSR